MAYNVVQHVKERMAKTKQEAAQKWQVSSIRTHFFKVAATVTVTKSRIRYRFSKSFVHRELLQELLFQ